WSALVNLWVAGQVEAFRLLAGKAVARWVGVEMAIRERGPSGLPQFEDASIPFLQLLDLYAEFGDAVVRVGTYQNDDAWGLRLDGVRTIPDWPTEEGSISRIRHLAELPAGLIMGVDSVLDASGDLVELTLRLAAGSLVIRAGEVYEEPGGEFCVVHPDESVLASVVLGSGRGALANEKC
ncbi:hypothetical protein AB1L88_18405, partial [Tautonia sp. JC769]|uniref:hypothetical protein n=1 Tax=Tautonia sp. JC769 TaxID=3232135 RepID=UPI0034593AF9